MPDSRDKLHELDEKIARRLRIARLAADVSQQAAGDALGVSFQAVQKQEQGESRVSLGALATLADLYKKPVAWFFRGLSNGAEGSDEIAEFLAVEHGAEIAARFKALDRDAAAAVLALLRYLTK